MTSVSFDVPIIDDNRYGGSETFSLSIGQSSLPNNVDSGVPNLATVTILNDEGYFLYYLCIVVVEHIVCSYISLLFIITHRK